MGVGAFIAINEELTGRVHPELLILAALFVGGPAVAALYALTRTLGSTGRPEIPPTATPSSQSAQQLP
jgi:hypothetical protein